TRSDRDWSSDVCSSDLYYRPEEGRVVFEGRDVTGLPAHAISRLGLTRTFQIVKPFGNLCVADNVMIGALTRLQRVRDARVEAERSEERRVGKEGGAGRA